MTYRIETDKAQELDFGVYIKPAGKRKPRLVAQTNSYDKALIECYVAQSDLRPVKSTAYVVCLDGLVMRSYS